MKNNLLLLILLGISMKSSAQQNTPITRIARITIDSSKLVEYRSLLKEQMETAVRVEAGVISYQVYADKIHASLLTIVEVYANNAAYLLHRQTPHFIKYKNAVADMVKSLELAEVEPILTAKKKN